MTRPLEGVLVVSIEQAVAAPFATRHLADLGARVLKIERPKVGDFARGYDRTVHGQSSYFVWLNRSKESITLDFKSPQGREVLAHLIARADVFVSNLAPGAVDRVGLDATSLRAENDRLITCLISGYGTTGAWASRKAYDMLVQAEAGLMSATGSTDAVARAGISVADIAAGTYAFSGVLTALLQRATTGRGAAVEVSLFEALAEWMGSPLYYAAYGDAPPVRAGAEHATIAPYGPFAAGDGVETVIAIQNEREWVRFCRDVLSDGSLAEDPRFTTNSDRVANRIALNARITDLLASYDTPRLTETLDRFGIANGRVNTLDDLVSHDVLSSRDRWVDIETPGGPVSALRPPVDLDGADPVMGPVPGLGEHTESVLAEFGYAAARVAALRAEGVV
jgi:formyl-CoA transferase